ncbi:sigma-70 family RNA polymerase sigma factor [Hymenobacter sp. 5516J-16]|uniref:Sigma-70 family RNA polymerase sigma factor n=1 Tax=Hymenobacter sublimis TaxID=2933777 RepID=A0ABY4J9T6_9BACT|nr:MULTISPECIES: sigma-70 family RNA polymerase sigma factor [Hymenobacter]UOQ75903.1 sigma-70 family RNA polymerase sigma factor [Hymenobacter sp. 5516J-16]UPL49582.1 sigma-70 family RNA polymerase sigma factor [Hymenobacter sublimis]
METIAYPLDASLMTAGHQDLQIQEAVRTQRTRLLAFIRRRIPDETEAEDVLQDVFAELVESYRMLKPVEQAAAWLFRVARNKITDLYRRKKPVSLEDEMALYAADGEENTLLLADILPAPDDAPENRLLRETLMEALSDALAELPAAQRQVFIWHELEDKTFREMEEETGVPLKTLISRKHYAVQHLRKRLQTLYTELFTD